MSEARGQLNDFIREIYRVGEMMYENRRCGSAGKSIQYFMKEAAIKAAIDGIEEIYPEEPEA